MKKKRKTPTAIAKSNAWNAFSKYIRTRDCIRFRNSLTEGMCVTCKRHYPFKKLQAGHFIQGRGNSVLLDERLVYSQCLTEESKLRMFNGTNTSIKDIAVGDELWAFNEQYFSLAKATVEKKDSYIPEKLYEVELQNGDKFYATPDHRVVANGQWMFIEDMLHNVSAYDIFEL